MNIRNKAQPNALYSKLVAESRRVQKESLKVLANLIKYKSVNSREPDEVKDCAQTVSQEFRERDFTVRRFSYKGAPLILAEKYVGSPKTLMFYHHYDVQPEGDLSLWKSSPWVMARRGTRLYGRGTSDDKGPLVASIFGVEVLEDLVGRLPVNVRFVVDGEEETGLPKTLPNFEKEHPELLKADGCVWEVASALPGSRAEVFCGMKGDAYFELLVGGTLGFPRVDVHSSVANAVPNAAWRLVWALNSLKDSDEKVLIDGMEEEVVPPSKKDLSVLRDQRWDLDKEMMREYGINRLLRGRSGMDLRVALWFRPAVTISGLTSGCQGEDMTIVPARASAKVDIRLVPNLTVEKIERLLRKHLTSRGFDDVEVVSKGGFDPGRTPVDHPFVQIMHEASNEVVAPSKADIVPMSSASGPVAFFARHAPICMTFSAAEAQGTNTHAPNENALLASMTYGIAFTALITQRMGERFEEKMREGGKSPRGN